jgi:biopolymer transport protein ExbB/TolQ
MTRYHHPYAAECARRAAERAAAIAHQELSRGTACLRAIAHTAPLLGMLGTTVLMITALRAYALPTLALCCCGGGPAETLVPTALSVPIAIFAWSSFRLLRHQIETFDLEMRTATLDLLDDLERGQHMK